MSKHPWEDVFCSNLNVSMHVCFLRNSGPGNRKKEKVSETDRSKAFISATKNIQPISLKQSQNRLAKKSILSKVKLKW